MIFSIELSTSWVVANISVSRSSQMEDIIVREKGKENVENFVSSQAQFQVVFEGGGELVGELELSKGERCGGFL